MENILPITSVVISVVIIVFAVLQIILFFKVWGMTNDVRKIVYILNNNQKKNTQKIENAQKIEKVETSKSDIHNYSKGKWGKDVTDEEKKKAQSLISKLMDNELILLVDGKIVVYDSENLADIENYKVIYYK